MTLLVTKTGTDEYIAIMNGTTIKTLSEKIKTIKTKNKKTFITIKNKDAVKFTKIKALLGLETPGRLDLNDLNEVVMESDIRSLKDNKIYHIKIK